MLDGLTFGEFITAKRKQANMSLRQFSASVSLSPTFVSHMERGMRAAPSQEIQIKMAQILNLNEKDLAEMFDLAAQTKRNGFLPADIAEYIENDRELRAFLRKASRLGYTGKDLLQAEIIR